MNIGVVCGSFHRDKVEQMLEYACSSAEINQINISEIVWVPGSMEIPLALQRLLIRDDIDAAACLSIIEKGETQHGLAMGMGVISSILELQLSTGKPIGLGIIGPGAEPEHIGPRLELHARAAIEANAAML